MKKMMILVSSIMMAAASYANNVATKPFESVKVNVPARVRFVTGENYEMEVRSTNNVAANSILWSIENGVLKIRSRYENDDEMPSNLCITIVSPVEPKLLVGRDFDVKMVTEGHKADN